MNIKNNKLMIVFSLIFVILFFFGSIEKAIADVDVWSIYLPLVQKSVSTTGTTTKSNSNSNEHTNSSSTSHCNYRRCSDNQDLF